MSSALSWRDLLKQILSDPAERDRLVKAVGVSAVTLQRWCSGESTSPRPHNLQHLLRAVPVERQAAFAELLRQEYGPLQELEDTNLPEQIDYLFLRHYWETRATTPAHLQFWALSSEILQNAFRQLTTKGVGLALTVAQVMPPSPQGVVHSLREVAGLGSSPWPVDLEHHMQFLGAESLVGYVASHCHAEFIDDLRQQNTILPAYRAEYEVSALVAPILYANCIAGCLLCSSNQPDYFRSEARRALLGDYTQLLASAFTPEQFVDPQQIQLQLMPPRQVQQTTFATFQTRVNALLKEAYQSSRLLTRPQAEQQVWQQLEEDLLHSVLESGTSPFIQHE
jgi:transcriptional regulator with XRE-family HTH domain